ncbi:hypothetical protein [Actinoallomurus rhizosphaericola]|uniref:hypothetical protein n=1 Tax=Actinoallomurus rhizosphaericola TaxID=2952536 RepID=UPI0020914D9D|nr:hypothetical protein [Actinoallomurus rhizosphaericola]MCO5993014.1 hypothetical protein [Actinoallomurus rhizosphaericola]
MSGGYALTTVSNKPGRTHVSTGFYLDERAYTVLYPDGETRPFLSLELGDTEITIGPRREGPITDEDVTVFRNLAAKAAALLAEVERIHAEQSNQSGHAAA